MKKVLGNKIGLRVILEQCVQSLRAGPKLQTLDPRLDNEWSINISTDMVYKYKTVTHRIQLEIDGWPFGLLFYHTRCSKRHLAVSSLELSWDIM